jgi:hypothetical protein
VPPDPILTIDREGDHLSVKEMLNPGRSFFAASEEVFFSKADDEFLFGRRRPGNVNGVADR